MAMRYRHLKQCSFNKDAVAVYRFVSLVWRVLSCLRKRERAKCTGEGTERKWTVTCLLYLFSLEMVTERWKRKTKARRSYFPESTKTTFTKLRPFSWAFSALSSKVESLKQSLSKQQSSFSFNQGLPFTGVACSALAISPRVRWWSSILECWSARFSRTSERSTTRARWDIISLVVIKYNTVINPRVRT